MANLTVWRVAVEAEGWVGPLSVKFNGVETTYPWKTQLVLQGENPTDIDWVDPIDDPLGATAGKGFQVSQIDPEDAGSYTLCVQINAGVNQIPVLKEVATVVRY